MSNDQNAQPSESRVNLLLIEMSAYYKHTISMFEAALWQTVIGEFGEDPVYNALMQYCSSPAAFMPKVGEIRVRLGSGEASAALAFEEVRALVASAGPYVEPPIEDPAIVATIQALGGWVEVNKAMPDPTVDRFGFEALQKRFATLYTQHRAMATAGKLGPQLPLRSAHTPLLASAVGQAAIAHEAPPQPRPAV